MVVCDGGSRLSGWVWLGVGRVGGALIGGGGCIGGSGIGVVVTLNKCIWACCKLRMRDSPRLLN